MAVDPWEPLTPVACVPDGASGGGSGCSMVENCVDANGTPVPLAVTIEGADITIDNIDITNYGVFSGQVCTALGPVTVVFQVADGVTTLLGHIDTIGAFVAGAPTVAPCPDDTVVSSSTVHDVEWVCNTATNVLDRITTTTVDANPPTEVVVPTAYACGTAGAPDFETETECRNGTVHRVLYSIAPDGVRTELEAIDTTDACNVAAAPELKSLVEVNNECLWDVDETDPANPIITPFVRSTLTCVTEQTDGSFAIETTALGDFEDSTLAVPYAPANTVMPVGSIGEEASAEAAEGITIVGPATYTPAGHFTFIESLTVFAIDTADVGGDVTVTHPSGSVSKLRSTQSRSWHAGNNLPLTVPSFDIPAGFEVDFSWIEPTA